MVRPRKIYISATLFDRFIEERRNTGDQARLGLLLCNKAGVCVSWHELEGSEDTGCENMPGIEDSELVSMYTKLSKKYTSKVIAGFGYLTSNENNFSLIGGGDTGADLWKHKDVPFVIFSPTSTIAEVYDSKTDDNQALEVAVVDDKFKVVESNKPMPAKAGSKRKTTRTKVKK